MSWKGWLGIVVVLGLGATAWLGGFGDLGGGDEGVAPVAAEVRRGVLDITVVERGNLKAANSVDIKSEIEGQTTILFLMEEGKIVEAGDLICELDATSMVEKRISQEITVQNAEASLVKATQNLEIQKSKNESDIAKAQRTRSFAEIDSKKYLEGDWLSQEQEARDNILIAEEELKRADDTLTHSNGLFEKGYLTRTEYEADELAKKRKEIALEQAKRTQIVLMEYDHPRRMEELEADIVEADREVERVKLESEARLVDYEAEVRSAQARLDLERDKFTRLDDQIAKAKIYAPMAGMIVHAQPDGGRNSQGEPLNEGSTVRERQDLITIPSSEGMIAEVSLHESVLEKVQVGMQCSITVDALPGVVLPGEVRFKAVLPDKNSWFANPNQRLYRTTINVTKSDPRLRPGMSCSIEIHVQTIKNTLHVPVQAVFADGGNQVCFVVNDDGSTRRVPVEVGSYSAMWAEIKSGLTEADRVSLSLPEGETLAPAPRLAADEPSEGPPSMGGDFGGMPANPSTDSRSGGGRPEGAPSGGEGAKGAKRPEGSWGQGAEGGKGNG